MSESRIKAESRANSLRSVDKLSINLSMDYDAMHDFITRALAQSLYRARLPWLPGERINVGDLAKPAACLMGILAGGDAALGKDKEH